MKLTSFGNFIETITEKQEIKGYVRRWIFLVEITLLNRESVLTRNDR
jgi:hypothetical protein